MRRLFLLCFIFFIGIILTAQNLVSAGPFIPNPPGLPVATADGERHLTITGSHGPIKVDDTHNYGPSVTESGFWNYTINIYEKDKPDGYNDTLAIDAQIQHIKSPHSTPCNDRDGIGDPIELKGKLAVNADDAEGDPPNVVVRDAESAKAEHGKHRDLLNASIFARVETSGWATDDITSYSFTLDVKHIFDPDPNTTIKNGYKGAPAAGGKNSTQMSFDAGTGKLSFTNGLIDFVNLAGDESLDSTFASDPLLGATISITDFTLTGPFGEGVLFTGGKMDISKDGEILFAADIPELLIDDGGLSEFGLNYWGQLGINSANIFESHFLDVYTDYSSNNLLSPLELMGRTSIPVEDMIRNGQSFTTTVEKHLISASTPEPSTILLFGFGFLGLLGVGGIKKRVWKG